MLAVPRRCRTSNRSSPNRNRNNKNHNYIIETSKNLKNWKLLRAFIGTGEKLSIGKIKINEINKYYRLKILVP